MHWKKIGKKTVCNELVKKKIKAVDTNGFVLKTQYKRFCS